MQALAKPTRRIEVLYRRTFNVAAVIFFIFFGGLTILVFINGIKTQSLISGFFNLLLLIAVGLLLTKGKRKSVKLFDASGITRGDGRHLLWSDFRGAISRISTFHYGGKSIWRIESLFAGGREAWIIPQRIKILKKFSISLIRCCQPFCKTRNR